MDIHVLVRSDQYAFLLEESARTGLPVAALIRDAIDVAHPELRAGARGVELTLGFRRRLEVTMNGRRLRRVP